MLKRYLLPQNRCHPPAATLGEGIADESVRAPDKAAEMCRQHEAIWETLACLPSREARLLRLRFGLGSCEELTLGEVGDQLNINRERARQIETRALRWLRDQSGSPYRGIFLQVA